MVTEIIQLVYELRCENVRWRIVSVEVPGANNWMIMTPYLIGRLSLTKAC